MQKKAVSIILKIVASLLVISLLAGIGIQLLFSDSLKSLVIKTINERASTKIYVNGEISFSIFEHFPYVSVNLKNVRIEDTFQSKTDLLNANKISVQINLWNLLTGMNTISKVAVYDGRCHIRIDKRGRGNYFIFKKTEGTEDSKVNINKILLHKIECTYNDEHSNQYYELLIKGASLSGNFSASLFDLSLQGEMFIHHLFVNHADYATNKDVKIKGGIRVNNNNSEYHIQSMRITINESDFKISGKIQDEEKYLRLDFFISGAESGLADVGALLPNEYSVYLQNIRTKGRISFTGSIKGKLSAKENPEVLFIFDVKNATIAHRESNQKIESVNMQIKFSNGTQRSWNNSTISIKNAQAVFGNAPIRFDIELNQFRNPYLMFNIDGTFRLTSLTALFGKSEFDELDGLLKVENLRYRGYLRDAGSKKAFTQSEGKIILSHARFRKDAFSLENVESTIELQNDVIGINYLTGNLQDCSFSINGELNHFMPVLFRLANDKNYNLSRAYLVNLNIETGALNTQQLLASTHSMSQDEGQATFIPRLIQCAAGTIQIRMQSLTHRKIILTDLSCRSNFSGERFYFNHLKFNAWRGNVSADGSVDLSKDDVIHLESVIQANNIDIREVFTAFENFDQQTLTDKNINGILNTSFTLKAEWVRGVFQPDRLQVLADVTINKGELLKFKPIYALSRFVKMEELEDIKFTKLNNQISIQNKTVFIPSTIINTNVLNMQITGTHTFENIIDYNVKLNLLQLMSNKFRNNHSFDPDAAEKDPSGLVNLYLSLKGPADNPVIKYDKQSVKSVIKDNMKQEQQTLKDAIKKEFNKQQQLHQQEQIKDWEPPQEYELIEFEEDSVPK